MGKMRFMFSLFCSFFILTQVLTGEVHSAQSKTRRINTKRGQGYELKIPNASNPKGGKAPNTLDEQIKMNVKYLKKLQADMNKQVNTANTEFIKYQPIRPEQVNQTKKYPIKLPEPELEKLFPSNNDLSIQSAPFSLPAIMHHMLNTNPSSTHRKDLVSNMNIKGNMDQLKKLMNKMSKEIDESNKAILDRNRKKQKAEQEADKAKDQKQN